MTPAQEGGRTPRHIESNIDIKFKRKAKANSNCILLVVPRYIPVEVRLSMIKALEPIMETFRLKVEMVESLGKVGGATKCPVCEKKFVDISGYRAFARLAQHIKDKHPDLLKAVQAIQTPPTHEVEG